MTRKAQKHEIFTSLASMGQAIGNPHRLKMVSLLSHGEKTVERLATAVGQSLAATSAHLKVLRTAGPKRPLPRPVLSDGNWWSAASAGMELPAWRLRSSIPEWRSARLPVEFSAC